LRKIIFTEICHFVVAFEQIFRLMYILASGEFV